MHPHYHHLSNALAAIILAALLAACGGDVVTSASEEPDPVVVDIPIAFVKRDLPLDDNGQVVVRDLRDPFAFVPGAGLYMKARASASAEEINLTDRLFQAENVPEGSPRPQYDIKDLEVSYDGSKLLFALRAPAIEDADDDEQPTWNIWEYDRRDDSLRRIIVSDTLAEAGEDTGPVYLPDGRILFSSTRQRANQAILLDEGKPQYQALEESLNVHASVLHVMDADGNNIRQVSFNQSHDLDPLVLPNGKVLFSRWDQAAGDKGIHLYQMNPDGSELEILYGRHSHSQNQQNLHFVQSRFTQDNRVLVALREYRQNRLGGDYALVDLEAYIDLNTPTADNPSLSGPAQQPALFDTVDTLSTLSPGGYFASLYPLWDGSNRQLFAWSQCRAYDPDQVVTAGETRRILPCSAELLERDDVEPAPLLYGLWMYDPASNTQLVLAVPQEGQAYTEVVSMEARPFPADYTGPEQFDAELATQDLGLIHIRSVYDFAGTDTSPGGLTTVSNPSLTTPNQRPARFLRVVKSVSIPDEEILEIDGTAFGRSRGQLMREIIGYVPVEPDGSVRFLAPAKVPLAISVVDANGRRLGERHQNWLQVAPGEARSCNGCHSSQSTAPHGRADAEFASINLGAPSTGSGFPGANPALFADLGETMAETATRINGVPYPSPDIVFEDIWTDPANRQPAPGFAYRFADLATPLPINASCAQNWTALCRIQLNYPSHIQPLFELDRRVLDENGELVQDRTCISCHTNVDAQSAAQVPAAQLDLSATPSLENADWTKGYRELLFPDNEQELVNGALVDRLVVVTDSNGNVIFLTDDEGNLILDDEGNPIPLTRTVPVANAVSVGGARASNRFFVPFDTGSHQGWLSGAELKMLAEWMDIGAQYYNNPFDAPRD
ncbi:hypothetical protein P2G88_06335 [Aliiglaciecola sp. CAU 1673]|uniref:HzsA-related protein n=1 Tax=Aliiglaciecola sp. CAU 1673 TaxID=3032595 RepID=UPI0023DBD8BF|nr:hypothetical protein [Aliiglaciecola sp. CAU 1673]MDF2177864.1 hypothetical protein [Aliiglaciecola sp. CAU 1673]